LPGYNAMLPLNKYFRWMIVWDCASELPEELTTDVFAEWNEVPDHVLMRDVDQWISAQFKKMPPLGQLFEEAEIAKGNGH